MIQELFSHDLTRTPSKVDDPALPGEQEWNPTVLKGRERFTQSNGRHPLADDNRPGTSQAWSIVGLVSNWGYPLLPGHTNTRLGVLPRCDDPIAKWHVWHTPIEEDRSVFDGILKRRFEPRGLSGYAESRLRAKDQREVKFRGSACIGADHLAAGAGSERPPGQ